MQNKALMKEVEKNTTLKLVLGRKVELGSPTPTILNSIIPRNVELLFEIEFTLELEMLMTEAEMAEMITAEIESIWICDLCLIV